MSEEKDNPFPDINQHTMIQYLLGELPLAWQEHFEEQFFTNKEKFEQLKLVEDKLVDDYVSQSLPESQRVRFETHFLNSKRRRQKLKFAQTLQQSLAELRPVTQNPPQLSFWQSIIAAWRTSTLRYSFASLVVIAIVGGGWLWLESLRLHKQRQQLETERAALTRPTVSPTPIATPGMKPGTPPVSASSPLPVDSPSAKPAPSQTRANAILTLMLPPGTFRDDQAVAGTLAVTPQTKAIRLQLALKGAELYSAYRIVIETASGQVIQTRSGLRPMKFGQDNIIVFQVIARSLPANDYLLTLSGKKANRYEEVDDYQLRITQRQ